MRKRNRSHFSVHTGNSVIAACIKYYVGGLVRRGPVLEFRVMQVSCCFPLSISFSDLPALWKRAGYLIGVVVLPVGGLVPSGPVAVLVGIAFPTGVGVCKTNVCSSRGLARENREGVPSSHVAQRLCSELRWTANNLCTAFLFWGHAPAFFVI